MSKFIIENKTDISDLQAIKMIKDVIKEGRCSNNNQQYCYATRFGSSTRKLRDIIIWTYLNKCSDRFVIQYDDIDKKDN